MANEHLYIDADEEEVVVTTPRVRVHYVTSISALDGLENHNVILHPIKKNVNFFTTSDTGRTRICIVTPEFDNVENVKIRKGTMFLVSECTRGTESGIHMLVLPNATTDKFNMSILQRNAARAYNIKTFKDVLESMKEAKEAWRAISFWKPLGAEETKFMIDICAPSQRVTVFTPTEQKYTPVPGMHEYIDRGIINLWGELAADVNHPAYKRAVEVR